MQHLVSIALCCTALFTGTLSNCHPRVYLYHKDTGIKEGDEPVSYTLYKMRELTCFPLPKGKCIRTLDCLWRERGASFPIEAPSIKKITGWIPEVIKPRDVSDVSATMIETPTESDVQSLAKAESLVTMGPDGVMYDIEYTSFDALMQEADFKIMHDEVVKEFQHAVRTLVNLFSAAMQKKPSKDVTNDVITTFEKKLKNDGEIHSNQLKTYTTKNQWKGYLRQVAHIQSSQPKLKRASTQKTVVSRSNILTRTKGIATQSMPHLVSVGSMRRLLVWNDVVNRNQAPYSSFGLIGAFTGGTNDAVAVAGGTIINVRNWWTWNDGWTKWVYVVAAAHDIIRPHYNAQLNPALLLYSNLDKFKFYPGFSDTEVNRKLNHDTDGWECRRVWMWPTYKQAYIRTGRASDYDSATDIAVFEFKVPHAHLGTFQVPNPMAELYVRNPMPGTLHMAAYDVVKVDADTFGSFTMQHNDIPDIDCTPYNGEMCDYGGDDGMFLKPGFCGGPIFDNNHRTRIVAMQVSISSAEDHQWGYNDDYNHGIGHAVKITTYKKRAIDWTVGFVINPLAWIWQREWMREMTNIGIWEHGHHATQSRTEYENMFERNEYDEEDEEDEEEEYDTYDEIGEYDDGLHFGYNEYEPQRNIYVLDIGPSYSIDWITWIFLVLVICFFCVMGCYAAGGVSGFFIHYILSLRKKEKEEVSLIEHPQV